MTRSNDDRGQPFPPRTAELGAAVYGANGKRIGTVSGLTDTGAVPQIIIDIHRDPGPGPKTIMVPASELEFFQDNKGVIHAMIVWTKDQLRELPRIEGVTTAFDRPAPDGTPPIFSQSPKEDDMPAQSKAQQQAAAIALSVRRGDTSKDELRGASKDMYETMSEAELEELASTPRKGLPEHKG